MAFAEAGLGVVAEAQGVLGFTWWSYATTDPLGRVLEPDYFNALSRRVQAGELVLVGVRPGPGGADAVRRALLMVSRAVRNGAVSMRFVQDYGGAEDPAAGQAPVPPRPRGRPRKVADAPEYPLCPGQG